MAEEENAGINQLGDSIQRKNTFSIQNRLN